MILLLQLFIQHCILFFNFFRTKKNLYLVQGYETDFFSYGCYFKAVAEKTYSLPFNVEYITISRWCENWLWKKYKKKFKFAPNGNDFDNSNQYQRKLKGKKFLY